jgi:hypothetical protein
MGTGLRLRRWVSCLPHLTVMTCRCWCQLWFMCEAASWSVICCIEDFLITSIKMFTSNHIQRYSFSWCGWF